MSAFGFTLRDNMSPQTFPSMVRHYAQRIDALMYQRYGYEYRLGENKIMKNYKLKYLALILLC
jgi:hypothetical protein